MALVETTITAPSSMCKDVIGVKGLCSTNYPYNLDSLGISLNKAANLADSSKTTGKALIQDSIEMAWEDVLSDLRIDGFSVNGVQNSSKEDFITTKESAGTYTKTISRNCDIETIFINSIKVKTDNENTVTVSLIYNGTEVELTESTIEDETLIITVDAEIDAEEVTVKVISTDELYKSNGGGVAVLDYFTQCSEKSFLCKYWTYLVRAVMYKATAHILNASLFSDRYNDFIVYKKDEIALRVAQLDSSFNLLSRENRINTEGMYQAEIKKINDKLKEIVKESYCTCCFRCDNMISSSISLP